MRIKEKALVKLIREEVYSLYSDGSEEESIIRE